VAFFIFIKELYFNPEYALENLLRAKSTSNQCFLKFKKRSAAMIFKFKELIYCIFNSHNEVLTHILGLKNPILKPLFYYIFAKKI